MITDAKSPEYDRLISYLTKEVQITVGVHGTEGGRTYHDGPTVAEIAEAAEFGLGQPQRSWLRAWFDEHKTQIEATIGEQFALGLVNGESQDVSAERVALWMQASIQKRIAQGISPPNHPITIQEKGSSVPLIDTGVLRSSIVAYVNRQRAAA